MIKNKETVITRRIWYVPQKAAASSQFCESRLHRAAHPFADGIYHTRYINHM